MVSLILYNELITGYKLNRDSDNNLLRIS